MDWGDLGMGKFYRPGLMYGVCCVLSMYLAWSGLL